MDEHAEELTKHERRERAREERMRGVERRRTMRAIVGWTVVLLGAVGIVAALVAASGGSQAPGVSVKEVSATDWVRGATDAKVTLIEYGDFQCPACAVYFPLVTQLEETYKDSLRLVFREFPLRTTHRNADIAARAAEAAGKQGKFWEMYEKLYDEQSLWSDLENPQETFAGYAEEMGISVTQWTTDLDDTNIKAKIEADIASGNAARVGGTPTFFVNGQQINNPRTLEEFQKILDNAIKNAPVN